MKRVSKTSPQKPACRLLLSIALGFGLGLAGLSGLVYGKMPSERDLGPALTGGSFTLVRHDGSAAASADLAGRPSLVVFGYTRCAHFCSTALSEISAVFNELGQDKKIAALFITVDPEQDTPDVLKDYLENFDSRIIGLTGDP
ncbi:MAG: SCO family protein, partial [Methylocapsa sp.]|nr:SCO family protein [Methylocapsa sp.]